MVYLARTGRPVASGFFGSLALLTRLYAMFPVAGVGLFLLYEYFQKRGVSLRNNLFMFSLSACIPFLLVSLFLYFHSGGAYLQDILLFRLSLIPVSGIPKLRILQFFVRWDLLLAACSILFFLFGARKKLLPEIFVFAVLLIFFIVYQDLYYLYFMLLTPFLALFSANFIAVLRRRLEKPNTVFLIAFIIILLLFHNLVFYVLNHATASRILFLDELLYLVESTSSRDDALFGSYEVVPLVALLTGRRVAGNIVDTNNKNFMTGVYDKATVQKSVKTEARLVFSKMVVDSRGEVVGHEIFLDSNLVGSCTLIATYPIINDYSANLLAVWGCGYRLAS